MTKKMKCLLFLNLFLGLCAFAEEGFDPNNVFGPDDRTLVTSWLKPYYSVGYLSTVGCTGTLIERDLVLTASHCVTGDNGEAVFPQFHPSRVNNQSSRVYNVIRMWRGTSKPNEEREKDWAILELDYAAGDSYSWYGIDWNYQDDRVHLAGYSGDLNGHMGVHVGCSIRSREENGYWLHDCDSMPGASGSSMFKYTDQGAYVVAIHVASRRKGSQSGLHLEYYHPDYANIAIPVSVIREQFEALLPR
jgi:protease YdgD